MKDRWPDLQDLIDIDGIINIAQIAGAAVAMQGRQVCRPRHTHR